MSSELRVLVGCSPFINKEGTQKYVGGGWELARGIKANSLCSMVGNVVLLFSMEGI